MGDKQFGSQAPLRVSHWDSHSVWRQLSTHSILAEKLSATQAQPQDPLPLSLSLSRSFILSVFEAAAAQRVAQCLVSASAVPLSVWGTS